MSTSEIATVLAWHDALNTADLDTLVSLSSDDIEIGDSPAPRRATPRCASGRGATDARSRSARSITTTGSSSSRSSSRPRRTRPTSSTAASAFRVVHDHVTSVFRHDDLAAALAATELTDEDLQV